jgi:small subunit ribosomal protein S6
MSNQRTGLYEGMFLFPQSATANLEEAIDHVKDLLGKSEATIINFSKWDDRRLAYEIEGNKRGVYFLVYFNAPTSAMSNLERRCNQSEQLLRMMVTRAEYIPSEIIQANEGAEELATEIKLRGEKSAVKSASTGSSVTRKDENEAKEEPAPAVEDKVVVTDETEVTDEPEAVEAEEVTEA